MEVSFERVEFDSQFLRIYVSPPAHPETTPRRVDVIREVRDLAEEQRAGETVVPQDGEEEGGG
eukprot:5185906-Pyramimonas_sp.AAC.1